MTVTIIAHLEWADDAGEFVWWAESEDLPGFTAVYPSLGELQREAENAIAVFCGDDGPVEVSWKTVGDVPFWAAAHISVTDNRIVAQSTPGNINPVVAGEPLVSHSTAP